MLPEEEHSSPELVLVSTLPREFNDLSAWIQKMYADLPKSFYLFINNCESLEKRQEILKDIVRIIGLKAHEMLYYRGSCFIVALIQYAMLLMVGLKGTVLPTTIETNSLMVDINALSFD